MNPSTNNDRPATNPARKPLTNKQRKRIAKYKAYLQLRRERSPAGRDALAATKPRLPNNSRYIADTQQWTGRLEVPCGPHEALVFVGTRSGVFALLASLDDEYRAWLAATSTGPAIAGATPAASADAAKGGAA